MKTSSVIRLSEILKEIHKHQINVQQPAIYGLIEVLGISEYFGITESEEDDGEIKIHLEDIKLSESQLFLIHEFRKLIRKTKVEILTLNVNHNLFLRYYNKIETLDKNVEKLCKTSWIDYKSQIDETVIFGIEHCVEAVKNESTIESAIDEDDLLKIKNEVENLTNEVLEKEIDTGLKKVIISLLESIKLAIIEYKINGVESFEKVLEQSIGKLIYNQNLWKNESAREDITKVSKILKKIADFINIAKGLKEIAQGLISMIPSLLP